VDEDSHLLGYDPMFRQTVTSVLQEPTAYLFSLQINQTKTGRNFSWNNEWRLIFAITL